MQKSKPTIRPNAAFTLVELLVSIGIFTVITSVAVFSHNQFNSSIILTNLAYEVALSVRQAQVYGITVKASGDTLRVFNSGYGIHFFDTADDATYKVSSYRLFEDQAPIKDDYTSYPDGTYSPNELLETFYLNRGNTIKKICFNNSNSLCTNSSPVDITFIRPNPDALILSSFSGTQTKYNRADICLSSPDNLYKRILVEGTGQISVVTDDVTICN